MKKKIGIIIAGIILVLAIGGISWFVWGISPTSNEEVAVVFDVNGGSSKLVIIDNLKKAGLIRSELAAKIYMFFNSDLNLQAGTYNISKNASLKDILHKMDKGDVFIDTAKVTLIEGKRLTSYVTTLSKALDIAEKDFYDIMSSSAFLDELLNTYWFINSDIKHNMLYYPLEGYLFPATYEFAKNMNAREVILTILNHTNKMLTPLKDSIEASNYSVHEILAMAAIIELEAVTESDRKMVSQVVYKRLSIGMSLGMDVTTYYAARKDMSEELTGSELRMINPYNTRDLSGAMNGKLPVGPICNPSLMSIQAALTPSDTDYLYFFADVKTGKVYFSRTNEEQLQVIQDLKNR